MATDSFKIKKSLNLEPGAPTLDAEGDVGFDSTAHKLQIRDDAATRNVVTEDGTATLENKTISGTNNTITDLDNSAIGASAGIERSKLEAGTASHVVINAGDGSFSSEATLAKSRGGAGADMSAVTFPSSGTIASNDNTVTFTNKTFDADATGNSISNIENADIKAAAGIERTKLASGTASHVLINDGSGVMSSEAALAATRGGTAQSTYTTGDLVYASAANTLSKLAIGDSGDILTVDAGVPTWAAPAGLGSGAYIGSAYASLATGASVTGTAIPNDTTIPQNTEGTEILTCAYTPIFADSTLEVSFITFLNEDANTTALLIAALFRDSDANAISVAWQDCVATSTTLSNSPLTNTVRVSAGSTATTTFKLRVGTNTNSVAIRYNGFTGTSSTAFGSTIPKTSIIVREVKA
jgi:hypothetical protein